MLVIVDILSFITIYCTDISWHVPNRYLILSFSYVIIISVQPVFSDGIVICFSDFYTRG